ncbi:hypothetical protein LWI29_026624 [Acer saccharum]|uniref:Cysteine proteinase inhibitor n=1 Tax=Acer saccharum TaxID=4024 RepID=A0AA39W0J6_ACESA|nr:hypothetical protein LWI29_026624 [Acer saccharum]KAK1588790.1 hypothetical protein Q3G72_027076 [Acer saccharum]
MESEKKPIVGGISEVKGSDNSVETDELARFAVDEHNKKQNTMVEFGRVISTKQQPRCGSNLGCISRNCRNSSFFLTPSLDV